jgi:hypothetical protein
MTWNVDARVPVRLGSFADAEEGDALLVEGGGAPAATGTAFEVNAPGHAPGCSCCAPRSSAALALNGLFQARAKAEVPFCRRVLAVTRTPEGDLAVWAAVRSDPLAAGRFRLEEG